MGTKAVVLGLSGGVDSAVAARLLLAAGYTVYGHWLDIGLGGREDAQSVAEALGIPFSTGDIRGALEREVMAPFQADYLAGRTPLPCARCNPTVKFPALFRRAEEVGAPFVATGHYARIRPGADGAPTLCRGAHANDQAYLLARLPQAWLGQLVFPLGDYAKTQVRQLARDFGLPVAEKPDSMEICFIPPWGLRRLAGGPGRRAAPRPFVDRAGKVLGTHKGIHHYTIGQRRGLGIPAEHRLFVSEIRPEENTVVLSDGTDLMAHAVWGSGWNPWPPWSAGRGSPSACATPRPRPLPGSFSPQTAPGGAAGPCPGPHPRAAGRPLPGGHGAGQLLDHRGDPVGQHLREGTR